MNFRTELAKLGYNKGNSIDVEILVNEILPSLFSQQERSYSELIQELELRRSKQMNSYFKKFYNETIELIEQFKKK
jgi:translation initiation factor RLI1